MFDASNARPYAPLSLSLARMPDFAVATRGAMPSPSAPDATHSTFGLSASFAGERHALGSVPQAHADAGQSVEPDGATFLYRALPIPVELAKGGTMALSTILNKAFGPDYGGYKDFWLTYYGASDLTSLNFKYWTNTNTDTEHWLVNGSDIGGGFAHQTHVSLSQVPDVTFKAGNNIGPLAYVTVPTAVSGSTITEYTEYQINAVDPTLVDASAYTGAPTAAQMVAAATAFDTKYGDDVLKNNNDCHWIAGALGASIGATLTDNTQSLDCTQNEDGGFWRIVYRGTDPHPVTNWHTLVKPGDVVRMGWNDGSDGFHTATILKVNPNGSMHVYDNCDFVGADSYIGIHDVNYDQQTFANTITIYRLSPDHLYLMNGTAASENLPGTLYSDQIVAGSGNDTVSGWKGNDVLLGGLGNDTIKGGVGIDKITPGVGNDKVAYDAVNESTGLNHDVVIGFDFGGVDKFDVPFSVTGINNAVTTGTLRTGANFNADLTAAIKASKLGAHHAVEFTPSAGTLHDHVFLIVDANGTAGYQANQDLVVELTGAVHLNQLDTADFI